jgi:hypothetical protein
LVLSLIRLDAGAFVDKRVSTGKLDRAIQMTPSEVASEDPCFTENGAPLLSEESLTFSRIFFLWGHLYSVAAQVFASGPLGDPLPSESL